MEFRVGVGEWWVRGQESGVSTQGSVRSSWSLELELESGGLGVSTQESGVSAGATSVGLSPGFSLAAKNAKIAKELGWGFAPSVSTLSARGRIFDRLKE